MHQRPLPVAGDLNFEMARVENEFLEQHGAVAECRLGLGARTDDRSGKVAGTIDPAHAPPAPAGRCLDQHRKADARGGGGKTVDVLRVAVIAGNGRDPGGFGDPLRLDL